MDVIVAFFVIVEALLLLGFLHFCSKKYKHVYIHAGIVAFGVCFIAYCARQLDYTWNMLWFLTWEVPVYGLILSLIDSLFVKKKEIKKYNDYYHRY